MVQGFTFEDSHSMTYTERYLFRPSPDGDNAKTFYDMFLYKNPGLQKVLRFKLHSWGVQTMEKLAEQEHKFLLKKSELMQKTDELKNKIVNSVNVSINK